MKKGSLSVMLYRYETHTHTSEVSRCSVIDGASLAWRYKQYNFTGIFVTDHFFNGTTTVPTDLPWEDRVELFMKGFLAAKAEGERLGLDVFFGWEYPWEGSDFLVYGLGKEWLLANPHLLELSPVEFLQKVRADGGLVIHAHPFRYPTSIRLAPEWVDGVEVFNAGIPSIANERANWYAETYGLLKSAGTDNHAGLSSKLGGIYLPERISCEQDFVRYMKSGEAQFFSGRFREDGTPL